MRKAILAIATLCIIATPVFSKTYIVRLKKNLGSQTTKLKSLLKTRKVKKLNISFGNYYKVGIDSKAELSRLKKMKRSSNVISIDKNVMFKVNPRRFHKSERRSKRSRDGIDQLFKEQWALQNTGDNVKDSQVSNPKAGTDINALEAWKKQTGNKKLVIAVIDTGVNYKHPDLKDTMWINEQERSGAPGVDDDGNGFVDDIYGYDFANKDGDPMDDNDHGTHCAGIIAATHNDIGIRGVLKDVQIMAIKFLGAGGSGTFEAALQSIDYAIKNGAHIMSNSWGASITPPQGLIDAVKEAEKKGITFIIAAGNSNADNDKKKSTSNMDIDNVIAVGSHQGGEGKSYFSSYGKKNVHVFAPGSVIMSTVSKNKAYKKFSGTSMATPYVAGIAGLLKSMNPNLTPLQIRNTLIKTSIKSQGLKNYSVSQGRVEALKALKNIQD